MAHDPRVGGDTDEADEHRPRQPYRFAALQAAVEPSFSRDVIRRGRMNGVDEEVDVHQHHKGLEVVGELAQLRQIDPRIETEIMRERNEFARC